MRLILYLYLFPHNVLCNIEIKNFVAKCHKEGIRVIFDGVFNHTGRDFFAFKDILGVEEEALLKLSLPLGGGLARLRLTCGAASGLAVVMGLLLDSSDKAYVYEETRKLLLEVEKANGSLICKDLLESKNVIAEIGGNPEVRNSSYYDNRPCSVIVYNTTKILENYLINKSIILENN